MADISAKKRRKYAVVHTRDADKFPIFDAKSARSALRLINHARPKLTAAQKAAVIRRAAKYGVHPSDDE